MELMKSVVGKVVAGAVGLAVVVGGISWWRMEEADRAAILHNLGNIGLWLLLVLIAPWATFFVVPWIARRDSNLSASMLVLFYTVVEGVALAWLFDFAVGGAIGWVGFVVGILLSGAYNLLTLDWIAEKTAS